MAGLMIDLHAKQQTSLPSTSRRSIWRRPRQGTRTHPRSPKDSPRKAFQLASRGSPHPQAHPPSETPYGRFYTLIR